MSAVQFKHRPFETRAVLICLTCREAGDYWSAEDSPANLDKVRALELADEHAGRLHATSAVEVEHVEAGS